MRTPHVLMAELAYRPLEHILEDIPCRLLAAILDCSVTAAWQLKSGLQPATDEDDYLLRRWLEEANS